MQNVSQIENYLVFNVFLIPAIYYLYKYYSKNLFIIYLILLLSFFEGTLELLGLSSSNNRLLRDVIIVVLFLYIALSLTIKAKYPGLIGVIIFLVICVFSSILNNVPILQLLLFLRRILPPFLLMWIIINLNLNSYSIAKLIDVLIMFFIIQLSTMPLKYFIFGIREDFIGTMAIRGGSLTALIALFGTGASFVYLLLKDGKRNKLVMITLLFVVFGTVGGKRAIAYLIPVLFIIVYFVYVKITKYLDVKIIISTSIAALVLGIFLAYLTVRLNPGFNPENKIWGSFDLTYVLETTSSYNTSEWRAGMGRQTAPSYVYKLLDDSKKKHALLFGFGPGDIIASQYTTSINSTGDEGVIYQKYGLGYGARISALWMGIQTGIIGIIFYFSIFIFFLRKIYMIGKRIDSKKIRRESLLSIMVLSIFMLDSFTYSHTFTLPNALTYTLFTVIGLFFSSINNEVNKSIRGVFF